MVTDSATLALVAVFALTTWIPEVEMTALVEWTADGEMTADVAWTALAA